MLMTAALTELKRAWPTAEIHVAVTSAWAPLLENHPAISKIWKYERFEDRGARAKSVMRLALRLRRERFDCVANFHASPSSAMISFATGAPLRSIHFHGLTDRNRYSTVVIAGKGVVKPVIERDLDTVRALSSAIQIPAGALPRIYMTDRERTAARARFEKTDLKAPLMMLALGASRPSKAWPLERYAALAVDWAQKNGSVLAVAGPAEKEELESFLASVDLLLAQKVSSEKERLRIRAQISGARDLALRDLAAMLADASVFVGNDSGPKHMAVAVGCPTVTIFGPEDPFEWHPYDREEHPILYIESLACRKDAAPGMPPWCGVHLCVEEKHRCMKMIEVETVLRQCTRVARQGTAS